ncbi:MAG: DUF3306 domain-containing protein [Gallionella sp.]|nr:DUF3306 domain-containing protein [Gallionella sp.]
MSQDGKDNEKSFLSRWSQRKREAKLPDVDSAAIKPHDETEALPALAAESDAEETFDLSSLPKLEDVTETTDITGFLRKGVPESLRNAALRKSWALDPAIRNYVNPALDYAYDWNAPGGVPGNSELAAGTDIAKMVLQIMGSDRAVPDPDESNGSPQDDARDAASRDTEIDAMQNPQPDLPLQQVRLSLPTEAFTPVSAEYEPSHHVQVEDRQDAELSESDAPQQEVRRHGSAKPRI